ncbi:MAG: asparagine synthase (glutamine-hydrolyzing) [Nitrospirota bacterium]
MCGICGIFYFNKNQVVDKALLVGMRDQLTHRGPDDAGIYLNQNIGLGHRRLSIIDLDGGHQPIHNEDKSIWVILNGEIYNFKDLRDYLISKGHKFCTNTDTEVIVHLYEEKGDDFVNSLRGMFAFALWSNREKKLILGRDRVGKKPLYYYCNDKYIIFASEIKSILEDKTIKKYVDTASIDQYISFGYILAPRSIFKGINKLPAGHILFCTPENISIKEYWDINFDFQQEKSVGYYEEKLHELLKESVTVRLISDVSLGAFLSGGIDSSTIVALMNEIIDKGNDIITTSIGFYEDAYNELSDAKIVSSAYQTIHYEHIVSPDILDVINILSYHFDEPFADSSAIPTYYVSNIARKHVTVALSGDGGDEIFAGYSRHFVERWENVIRRIISPLGHTLASKIAEIYPDSIKGATSVRNITYPSDEALARKHTHLLFSEEDKKLLFTNELQNATKDNLYYEPFRHFYHKAGNVDPLTRALYVDIKTYLTDDILVKVDRMSMANSLEVRAPILDHKFLEFAATIPPHLKLKGLKGKIILKNTMKNILPPAILKKKKQGFRVPIKLWLGNELKEMAENLLFDGRLRERGFFNEDYVRKIWSVYLNGNTMLAYKIWILLMFELWHRRFVG